MLHKTIAITEWIVALAGIGISLSTLRYLVDEYRHPLMPRAWRLQGIFLATFSLAFSVASACLGYYWWIK